MGSRIMHTIIGYNIADSLAIEDKTSFLHGSIAPDAVSPKELSHFFTGEVADYSRHIDYQGFLAKYRSHVARDYILGYCTHLIADDMWLKGFYLPWLKNRMSVDERLYKEYHRDFRLLNGKLLDYYNITDDLKHRLSYVPVIEDLDEVKSNDVESFVPYVFSDMDYDKEDVNAQLNVFTFEQIVGYIETSVDIGKLYLKSIRQSI